MGVCCVLCMLFVIRVIRVIGGVHGCKILGRSRSSTLRPPPKLVMNGDQLRSIASNNSIAILLLDQVYGKGSCVGPSLLLTGLVGFRDTGEGRRSVEEYCQSLDVDSALGIRCLDVDSQ